MATDKIRFLVTRYTETITEESARDGESETEVDFQDLPMSLEDTVSELSQCCEASSWPIRSARDLSGREWATIESVDNYDGSFVGGSVHVKQVRKGHAVQCRPETLYRLFKLANLVSV